MRVKSLLRMFAVLVFAITAIAPASGPPLPQSATCTISCTVENIVEWSQPSFPDVDLGRLTEKNKHAFGKTSLILYTNGDVTIMADNSNAAELSFAEHKLLTRYKLRYDGFGIKQSGNRPTSWHSFDTFLKKGTEIIHIPTDGAVEVILSIKASIKKIHPENSGRYKAVQTLTACWKS